MMSRRTRGYIDLLTGQRDEARELAGQARAEAEGVRGRLNGERTAAHTIAAQLAVHAAGVGAELARVRIGSQRAVADALALRRLVAEHVDAVRNGTDGQAAVVVLVDQLLVCGISLAPDLHRIEADRAYHDATVSAAEAAAAVATAPVPASRTV